MGTDIHIEIQWREKAGSPWKTATPPKGRFGQCWFSPRRYDAFAILADVRNGFGFAGVVTGSGFRPISTPKGLPEDWIDSPPGDHSYSWLSLAEILDYDYKQTTKRFGIVSSDEFLEWQERGKPSSWSGGVSGPGIENINNMQMADRIATKTLTGREFTKVCWTVSYEEAMGDYLDFFRCLPILLEVYEPENIRIVFGFDS